jgi:membrane-bound inhibitor of C-type lysozyme
MFKLGAAGLVMSILTVSLCGCYETSYPELTVDIGPPVSYRSDNGDLFTARYGSLSDGSLGFVKVEMPNGQGYTLPQVMSGSGVRYTDERQLVWWLHQGTIRIDVRAEEGNWKEGHLELKKVRIKGL